MNALASVIGTGNFAIVQDILAFVPNIIFAAVVLIAVFISYKLLTRSITNALSNSIKRKQDVKTFLNLWRYSFFVVAAILILISFSGSLTTFGISVGFFSVMLGWALQKPITGIAAWLMIVTQRPFRIGDRIIIDEHIGDVADIRLFYIVLNEIGGTVEGEEQSGRAIHIPTSILFDKNLVNYTMHDPFILDEVSATVTYESNLAKAQELAVECAKEITKEILPDVKEKPFARVSFKDSGIDVKVRYYTIADKRQKVASEITEKIHEKISKARDIEFAYPHIELKFKQGAKFTHGKKLAEFMQ